MCSAGRRRKPRYARGVPETWWYDPRQGGAKSSERGCVYDWPSRDDGRTDSDRMAAYIIRRLLFMIPTLLGIMLVSFVVVQFAPGGPVERVIAQLSGADTGATSRISGSAGGDFGARGAAQGGVADRRHQLEISRRAGPRSGIHQEAGKAVRLRQAGLRALLPDAVELSRASISARAISATSACCSSSGRSCRCRSRSASG